MRWLKDHGVISNWFEYDELPVRVLEDCRLLMEAEMLKAVREAHG